MCKSLGIFATAHSDGKLYLRALPDVEAGDALTATIEEQPIQTLGEGPAAIIQVQLPATCDFHKTMNRAVDTVTCFVQTQSDPAARQLFLSVACSLIPAQGLRCPLALL